MKTAMTTMELLALWSLIAAIGGIVLIGAANILLMKGSDNENKKRKRVPKSNKTVCDAVPVREDVLAPREIKDSDLPDLQEPKPFEMDDVERK